MPPSSHAARLVPVPPGAGRLPAWCDRFLERPEKGDLFASRLWYDTTLMHALPRGTEAVLAATEAMVLPLLRMGDRGARLRSLATDYSVVWRPLPAPGADAEALHAAGRALGRLFRLRPPMVLDTLDAEAPGLDPLLAGLRAAGIVAVRFAHFGNWRERLPANVTWPTYLAGRPPALRNTVTRKLARASREMRFELVTAAGDGLEAGIAAYEAVRARSWKPHEPFPAFDGALMRALARHDALRLGILHAEEDTPVAAQYWALDRAGEGSARRAMLLKLAHAEASRTASPGTVLTAMMVQRLIEEDGVRELDFGRGDDPYKRLWVGQRRQRIGLVLADPLHPAGLLALARQAVGTVRRRLTGRGMTAA